MKAVMLDGMNLQFTDLKDDREIIYGALNQNPLAYQYLGK